MHSFASGKDSGASKEYGRHQNNTNMWQCNIIFLDNIARKNTTIFKLACVSDVLKSFECPLVHCQLYYLHKCNASALCQQAISVFILISIAIWNQVTDGFVCSQMWVEGRASVQAHVQAMFRIHTSPVSTIIFILAN